MSCFLRTIALPEVSYSCFKESNSFVNTSVSPPVPCVCVIIIGSLSQLKLYSGRRVREYVLCTYFHTSNTAVVAFQGK